MLSKGKAHMEASLGVWRPNVAPAFFSVLALVGCAAPDTPAVPEGADAQLQQGRNTYIKQCTACHGSDGGGGTGPALSDGEMFLADPRVEDDILRIVSNGSHTMPAFVDRLEADQIEGVVRYTSEVLVPR